MSASYISKEDLTTPKNGYETFVDHWWWEKDGMILDWIVGGRRYVQANRNVAVLTYMQDREPYKGHTPVFIPLAFYPNADNR